MRRLRTADPALYAAIQLLTQLLHNHRQLIRHPLHRRQRILLPQIHHLRHRRPAIDHQLLPLRQERRTLRERLLLPRRIARIQHHMRVRIHEIIRRQQRLRLRRPIIDQHLHIIHIRERERKREPLRHPVPLIDHLRHQIVNHRPLLSAPPRRAFPLFGLSGFGGTSFGRSFLSKNTERSTLRTSGS